MIFEKLQLTDEEKIVEMSSMATEIVREHFDPIIGKAQNDYMIRKFQTVDSIRKQLEDGYEYYFVMENGNRLGFMAFYPRGTAMYLSKFYLCKCERRKGYSREMLNFVISKAREKKLSSVELNVNKNNDAIFAYEKLGFQIVRTECNDIGEGFYMDDYVYSLNV
jgi:ribosomal protein S18 acetylase RimI-like enzyme